MKTILLEVKPTPLYQHCCLEESSAEKDLTKTPTRASTCTFTHFIIFKMLSILKYISIYLEI